MSPTATGKVPSGSGARDEVGVADASDTARQASCLSIEHRESQKNTENRTPLPSLSVPYATDSRVRMCATSLDAACLKVLPIPMFRQWLPPVWCTRQESG